MWELPQCTILRTNSESVGTHTRTYSEKNVVQITLLGKCLSFESLLVKFRFVGRSSYRLRLLSVFEQTFVIEFLVVVPTFYFLRKNQVL